MRVVKRTGEIVGFDRERIATAIQKAVQATEDSVHAVERDQVVSSVVGEINTRFTEFFPNVENIQDLVEKHLVLAGRYEIAKAYILYRAKRQEVRSEAKERAIKDARLGKLTAIKRDGTVVLFNVKHLQQSIEDAAGDLAGLDVDLVLREVVHNVYDGIPTSQIGKALVLAVTAFIERDPSYSKLAARLLRSAICKEVLGRSVSKAEMDAAYRDAFKQGIRRGLASERLDQRMSRFDLELLTASLKLSRDDELQYLGMQTLHDRYLLKDEEGRCRELPQALWMRVAMGLAIDESAPNERALEFYDTLSQLHYVASTPTLFHAGTTHPQLSSCYLTTIDDHLAHIFKSLGDNAQLSKWSGGIGNDWTNVRATGARIQSTNVESQGVVPFLKIANDVTMAINRSGKRRGATCAYLETWHYDIEDFLDLRKNTGDDRRRTHDMNTANWVPDLFIKRVEKDEHWSLFSPDEASDLHDLYGKAFDQRYLEYETLGERGELRLYKRVKAADLWRKMLTMLFETGHPWITFKDACNVRSPQDHVGVVHSSNLCTEITLNTSVDETAVCNLGSINLARHMRDQGPGKPARLDEEHLALTTKTAIRMLDNVIDLNFYPTDEARDSNLRHRPIGLGQMGFQDVLFRMDLSFDSEQAVEVADRIGELISYHAILASSELARERGRYESYPGSKWDRSILPIDTLSLLEEERGVSIEVSKVQLMDWTPVRRHIREHGMRNSNTMAIAPTATISNISGCFPCIEPIYKNIYVKSNISGEFTIVNSYLIDELKELGLWSAEMLDQVKYYDGNLSQIDQVPEALKRKYKEAFEIDPVHCIRMTAARGKWIDQSQSHNVFMQGASGKKLSEIYLAAWRAGLKTTYYLRTLAASQVEKSTLDAAKYGYTQKREYASVAAANGLNGASGAVADAAVVDAAIADGAGADGGRANGGSAKDASSDSGSADREIDSAPTCRIDDPDCEACQ